MYNKYSKNEGLVIGSPTSCLAEAMLFKGMLASSHLPQDVPIHEAGLWNSVAGPAQKYPLSTRPCGNLRSRFCGTFLFIHSKMLALTGAERRVKVQPKPRAEAAVCVTQEGDMDRSFLDGCAFLGTGLPRNAAYRDHRERRTLE